MLGVVSALAVTLPGLARGELTVQVELSKTSARVGDIVTLDVRAVSTVNAEVDVEVPPVPGLPVIGRRSSTQMSMSFGGGGQRVRREKTVRLELSVDTPGDKTLPPVTARAGGETARSAPLTLRVEAAAPVRPQKPTAGQVAPPAPSEARLFLRYRLSDSQVFLGDQVLLDLEIFADPTSSFQVESIPDPPDLDGFWVEVLDRPQRLTPRIETVQGRRYQVFRAWRMALFPLEAGPRVLEPISVRFQAGGSLFGGGRRIQRNTRPLELEVLPLPETGRPAGFSPENVGTYALGARVDRTKVEDGKAVVLEVTLSGVGNVKSARLPELEEVEGFRVYPPNVREQVDLQTTGVRGTKTAEILLVPVDTGRFTIPALTLPVFDPLAEGYDVLSTEPIDLTVEGASPRPSPPPTTARGQAPSSGGGPDRRPVRFAVRLDPPAPGPWESPVWWGVLGLGPLMWGGAAGFRRWRGRPRDREREREIAAARRAGEQIEVARTALREGRPADAAAAFTDALYARARAEWQVDLQGLTSQDAGATLAAAGLEAEAADAVSAALERASFVRFTPLPPEGDLAEELEGWSRLLERLRRDRR